MADDLDPKLNFTNVVIVHLIAIGMLIICFLFTCCYEYLHNGSPNHLSESKELSEQNNGNQELD